jgi:phasin family protein
MNNNIVGTTQELANLTFAHLEKVANLNLEISKNNVKNASEALNNLTSCTNPQNLLDKVNVIAKSSVEQQMVDFRNLCDVFVDTNNKLQKLVEKSTPNVKLADLPSFYNEHIQQNMAMINNTLNTLATHWSSSIEKMKTTAYEYVNTANQMATKTMDPNNISKKK